MSGGDSFKLFVQVGLEVRTPPTLLLSLVSQGGSEADKVRARE